MSSTQVKIYVFDSRVDGDFGSVPEEEHEPDLVRDDGRGDVAGQVHRAADHGGDDGRALCKEGEERNGVRWR